MTALCYSSEMERGRQEDWGLETSGTGVRVRRAGHSSHIQNETQLCHLDRYYFVFLIFGHIERHALMLGKNEERRRRSG